MCHTKPHRRSNETSNASRNVRQRRQYPGQHLRVVLLRVELNEYGGLSGNGSTRGLQPRSMGSTPIASTNLTMSPITTPEKEFIIRSEPTTEQDLRLPKALAFLIRLAESHESREKP